MNKATLDSIDQAIIRATQAGLPLTPRPFDSIGESIGIAGDEVLRRMQQMLAQQRIRRIGAVPNHYALGYLANGMTVWDVEEAEALTLGKKIGELPFVSHCYLRPRALPWWPYNLFAMVHAHTHKEADELAHHIATLLGSACHHHDILYSTRILKKTGLRLTD